MVRVQSDFVPLDALYVGESHLVRGCPQSLNACTGHSGCAFPSATQLVVKAGLNGHLGQSIMTLVASLGPTALQTLLGGRSNSC